jgi:metallo-beta-lactamase family protein
VGAATVVLEVVERGTVHRIGFSGDLGRAMLPIIRDPAPMPPVEVLLCEATYGNRKHEDIESARHALRDAIVRTAKRGGKVLIPAFSLERTQEIVYDLHVLWDSREIPAIPIVIDSPLADRVTEVFMKHPECYDREMYDRFLARGHNPFQFSLVRSTATPEESKASTPHRAPWLSWRDRACAKPDASDTTCATSSRTNATASSRSASWRSTRSDARSSIPPCTR